MSSKEKKTAKKTKMKKGRNHTPKNEEPTTDNNERRSATPEGQPISSPATPTENDNKDRSTQRVLSMPLPTDQQSTTDQQSAAIIDLSQERGGYLSKNTPDTSSDTHGLPPVLTQMKPLADEQTQQERTQAELPMRQEKRAEQQELQPAELIKLLVEGQAQALQQAQAERLTTSSTPTASPS